MTVDLSRAAWRKSSQSQALGDDCVELTGLSARVAVRDSKNPDGPKLFFSASSWKNFTHRIKTSNQD